MIAQISALYVYPIKSCRGLTLSSAAITVTGLANDRRWMLVNERGRFLTQREQPRLALIAPALSGAGLHISAPGMPMLSVTGKGDAPVTVTVWNDQCEAFDEGADAAQWFSDFLRLPVRLVRFDDSRTRLSSHDWTQGVNAANLFSDGYPMMLIGQSSLDDLNARLPAALPMNRFRPNIVVTGAAPYEEDRIHELCGDDVTLRIVKPCTRCKITTTDQETGVAQGAEPLSTLMRYRRDTQLRGVIFGQNVIIARGIGAVLQVGQSLHVRHKA